MKPHLSATSLTATCPDKAIDALGRGRQPRTSATSWCPRTSRRPRKTSIGEGREELRGAQQRYEEAAKLRATATPAAGGL